MKIAVGKFPKKKVAVGKLSEKVAVCLNGKGVFWRIQCRGGKGGLSTLLPDQ